MTSQRILDALREVASLQYALSEPGTHSEELWRELRDAIDEEDA